MNKIKRYRAYWMQAYVFLAVLLCSLPVHGQHKSAIDSIKAAYENIKTDSDKVANLIELSKAISRDSPSEKINAAEKALQLAEKIHWDKGRMVANIVLGLVYGDCLENNDESGKYFLAAVLIARSVKDTGIEALGDMYVASSYRKTYHYAKAIEFYRAALRLDVEKSNKLGVLCNMGGTYATVGDYPASLACYDSALKVLAALITEKKTKSKNDTIQIAGLDITIADIYIAMGEYDHALGNYKTALQLCLQTKNDPWAILSLTGIGKTYQDQNNDEAAIKTYNEALQMCKHTDDQADAMGIYNRLGKIYLRKQLPDKAMDYAQSALILTKSDLRNKEVPLAYTLLGEIYTQQKKYDQAIPYLTAAVDTCKSTGALDDEKDALQALSNAYQRMGQPVQALVAYKSFIAIRDSVHSIEKTKEFTRMEMTSDFEAKQMEDSLKHAQLRATDSLRHTQEKKVTDLELQKQKAISIGSVVGICLVLVLVLFVYRNYRQQKTANVRINTEKQRADEQRERAERSEQFKQQFLANMSHEIRTPMNAVSGMTDLLLDKNPRPDQTNYLHVISRSSDILLHLINDILDLSKIEAGKLELECMDFSLSDTIRQVKETLSVRSEEKGLQLLTAISDDIGDVLIGDPFRLTQILINLGGNAVKFTDRGSVAIDVKKLSEEGDTIALQFSITDTGIGIPPDKLSSIFESFTQVNSSDTRRYGGTGLGLSISRQLVELQGGSISVQSDEGRGTTFSFNITFKKGSAQGLQARTANERRIDGSSLNGLRILLADDNENNRLVANDALRLKTDVVIDEAVNGEQAIQLLRQNDYDVILMDVQMPVMDGLEATRYIRNEMPAPKNSIPIIALTASMLRNDLDKCLGAGMNTFVPKPFKTWQLIAAIADLTGRNTTTQAAVTTGAAPSAPQQATDLTYLRDFCEQEEDRIKKYISIYLKAIPPFEENVQNALQANDTEEMASLMHLFRPKWMMMGMAQSAELGRRIEALCKEPANETRINEYTTLLLAFNRQSVTELEALV